jgi:hypothetical protein
MRGNYSVKSDAFSFGVMVLEIVTGRKNNSNNDDGNIPQQSGDLLTTVSTSKTAFICYTQEDAALQIVNLEWLTLDYIPPCRYGSTGRPGRRWSW